MALLVEESGECAWLVVADGRFVFVCLSVAIMYCTRDAIVFFSNEAPRWVCKQTKYAALEWNKSQRTSPETSAFGPRHCVVRHITSRHHYFFQDNRIAITVNSERYLTMIQDFYQPALEAMQLEDTWFLQDGATAKTARVTMNCLRQMFPGRLSLWGVMWTGWHAHQT